MGARLAQFVHDIQLDKLPELTLIRAKHVLLDTIGCAVAGAHTPWATKAYAAVEKIGEIGDAVVIGWDGQRSASTAALLNGLFIQGLEMDDYHPSGALHSGALALPAALASAELVGEDSGRVFVEAFVRGIEVGPRLCMSLGAFDAIVAGFNPGGIFGPMVAAISASSARSSSVDETCRAVNIAATLGAGLMSAQFGSMIKRALHGYAARAGVEAAALATEGFTGIDGALDGGYGGLPTAYLPAKAADWTWLESPMTDWELERILLKPYPCMGGIHSAIDAALRIRDQVPIETDDWIRSVTIELPLAQVHHGGWQLQRPVEAMAAQMNHAFCVATALVEGRVDVEHFLGDWRHSWRLWRVIDRTRVAHDQKFDDPPGSRNLAARVSVTSVDGLTFTHEVGMPGVLDEARTREKFRSLVAPVLGDEGARSLEQVVLTLEERSLSDLIHWLRYAH